MRLYHVLLATAVTLLAASDTMSAAVESDPTKVSTVISPNLISEKRFLRVGNTADDSDDSADTQDNDDDEDNESADVDDSVTDSIDTEERDPTTLNSLKKLTSKLSAIDEKAVAASTISEKALVTEMASRVKLWVENRRSPESVKVTLNLVNLSDDALVASPLYKIYQKFLSPENVKQVLGLDKLSDEAIKASPNYKYYLDLMAAHTDDVLTNWVRTDVSTFIAWKKLGLDKLSAAELKSSEGFKTYVRYVTKTNSNAVALAKNAAKETSEAEMTARLGIWVVSQKNEEFVKIALGLDKLTGPALMKAANYKYLEKFLENSRKSN